MYEHSFALRHTLSFTESTLLIFFVGFSICFAIFVLFDMYKDGYFKK